MLDAATRARILDMQLIVQSALPKSPKSSVDNLFDRTGTELCDYMVTDKRAHKRLLGVSLKVHYTMDAQECAKKSVFFAEA